MNNPETDTRSVVEKVRKLLRLAEGAATDGERDAALLQARRLMDRHNLAQEQLDAPEGFEFVATERTWKGAIPPELEAATEVVATHFEVSVVHRGLPKFPGCSQLVLFGTAPAVAISQYVIVFLAREFKRRWLARCRLVGHRRGHRSYCQGLGRGAVDRLTEQWLRRPSEEMDLAIRNEMRRCREFTAKTAHMGTIKQRDLSQQNPIAYQTGIAEGRQIEVRKPLGGSTTAAAEQRCLEVSR